MSRAAPMPEGFEDARAVFGSKLFDAMQAAPDAHSLLRQLVVAWDDDDSPLSRTERLFDVVQAARVYLGGRGDAHRVPPIFEGHPSHPLRPSSGRAKL
jgi:hypothetical protein